MNHVNSKKLLWKISLNSLEKNSIVRFLFKKLAPPPPPPPPVILLKRLQHMYFPVILAKFFRTAFCRFLVFTEHLLLLPVLCTSASFRPLTDAFPKFFPKFLILIFELAFNLISKTKSWQQYTLLPSLGIFLKTFS